MTNQRRSRFLDVLTTDDSSMSTTRVMETTFWCTRSGASSSAGQVIDLASRRPASTR